MFRDSVIGKEMAEKLDLEESMKFPATVDGIDVIVQLNRNEYASYSFTFTVVNERKQDAAFGPGHCCLYLNEFFETPMDVLDACKDMIYDGKLNDVFGNFDKNVPSVEMVALMTQKEALECPVCFEKTMHKTKCGHPICHRCVMKLTKLECPLCKTCFCFFGHSF